MRHVVLLMTDVQLAVDTGVDVESHTAGPTATPASAPYRPAWLREDRLALVLVVWLHSGGLHRAREALDVLGKLQFKARQYFAPRDIGQRRCGEPLLADALHRQRSQACRKKSTLIDYATCVQLHLAPFFDETPIQRKDAKRIEALIVHLQNSGLHPKSVRNYVGTLSALLNFAARQAARRCTRRRAASRWRCRSIRSSSARASGPRPDCG